MYYVSPPSLIQALKKSSSKTFHFVHEGTTKDEWQTSYINTHSNPADMLLKSLVGGEKW